MLSRIDVSDRNVYQECQTIVGSEILTANRLKMLMYRFNFIAALVKKKLTYEICIVCLRAPGVKKSGIKQSFVFPLVKIIHID